MSVVEAEKPPELPGLSADRMIGVHDVAKLFGVNPATVRIWVRTGKLPPPVRVGHAMRWRPSAIARLIEGE